MTEKKQRPRDQNLRAWGFEFELRFFLKVVYSLKSYVYSIHPKIIAIDYINKPATCYFLHDCNITV